MKRVIKADSRAEKYRDDEVYLRGLQGECMEHIIHVIYTLPMMQQANTDRGISQALSEATNLAKKLHTTLYEMFDRAGDDIYVHSSETIKAYRIPEEEMAKLNMDDFPKGYFDDYYGQTFYEEYGDLVSEKCKGMIISKRYDDADKPGGLEYEANRLGIDDLYDLLQCLEGMCYNRKAVEISDYQYKVL